jgi:murein DD-endopeptidase MepM/ murein hydrolase activator NlpD
MAVVAFIGVGSFAAVAGLGPAPMPPAGMVAGAVDVADPLSLGSGATDSAGAREPTAIDRETGLSTPPLSASVLHDASEAGAGGAPPIDALTGYRWPLPRGRITLPFGPSPWGSRIVDGVPFHDGLDLATSCGDRIVAAHDGTVLAAGRRFDDVMGWVGDLTPYYRRLDAKQLWSTLPIVVIIDDGNSYRSIYAHFSKLVVRTGQIVHAGALLGYEGQTGRASGCHLHYGLFSPFERGEFAIAPAVVKRMKVPTAQIARIDPLLVLPARPVPTPKTTPPPSAAP